MSNPSDSCRRLLVFAALAPLSRADNALRYRSQQVFQQLMAGAVDDLGLSRAGWLTQPGGDSELAVLPPAAPRATVVGELVFAVNRRLAVANAQRAAEARLRLRVAMHVGRVRLDGETGFPGEAVLTVSRLIDAPALTAALAEHPAADVALIVTPIVYDGVVLLCRRPGPERFRPVPFGAGQAWIFMPEADVTGGGDEP